MQKPVNPGNHSDKSFVECNPKSPMQSNLNDDLPPKNCPPSGPSLEFVPTEELSWLADCEDKSGASGLCDPMQSGSIVNDLEHPLRDVKDFNKSTIYRYSKSIRGADEAMTDMFRNVVVLDMDGKAHPVPIIWGTQERAVAAILQNQVRKDNSLVVDRPVLPMLAINQNGMEFNQDRYIYHKAVNYLNRFYEGQGVEYQSPKPGFTTYEKYHPRDTVFGVTRGIPVNISYQLTAWALYVEDMNQIIEQILLKFSPIAYIRVRGVSWEVGVKLNSIADNLDKEPGEKQRVVKFQFNMTAESFVSQPIVRSKAVLRERINVFDSVDQFELNDVIARLEIAVKDFE